MIKNGGLAAMPTETVYGLGANVYDAKAVAKIFAVKRRPTFDPLISHIADFDALPDYALADERALALARRFWPGPFTMVLKRRGQNPGVDLACSGLPTTTVRMPKHPVAAALIQVVFSIIFFSYSAPLFYVECFVFLFSQILETLSLTQMTGNP